MKICLASSEVAPFAKTGGLADVTAALARFLARHGHDVCVFLPLYRRVREGAFSLEPHGNLQHFALHMGERRLAWSLWSVRLPNSPAARNTPKIWLVDCPELFDRGGIYAGNDEDALRFAAFSRAVIEACQHMSWAPDVFHVNDWHTALLPLYLRTLYAWDKLFQRSRALLTIHNIGYQGVFGSSLLPMLGLEKDRQLFWQEELAEGRINFLKTGILHANALTTVSETYAREIQTPELGMGLESILRERRGWLFGIVNGIDDEVWNPRTDPHLPAHYDSSDLAGKSSCKEQLLTELGLSPRPRGPVLGIVSRLTVQKGFDLLPDVLPVVLQREDLRVVVLGSGEERYERYFEWLQQTFPGKVCFWRGYNDPLAHKIEAGSDLFLMPSRYEPCGLNQLYSLRYGTAPLVRHTGGLADTVVPFDAATGKGNGFVFHEFTSEALYQGLDEALRVWRDRKSWAQLVQNAMSANWSWEHQGPRYIEVYRKIAAN